MNHQENKTLKDYTSQEFLNELERRIFVAQEIKFKATKIGTELQINFSFQEEEFQKGVTWTFTLTKKCIELEQDYD